MNKQGLSEPSDGQHKHNASKRMIAKRLLGIGFLYFKMQLVSSSSSSKRFVTPAGVTSGAGQSSCSCEPLKLPLSVRK